MALLIAISAVNWLNQDKHRDAIHVVAALVGKQLTAAGFTTVDGQPSFYNESPYTMDYPYKEGTVTVRMQDGSAGRVAIKIVDRHWQIGCGSGNSFRPLNLSYPGIPPAATVANFLQKGCDGW